MKTVEDRSDPRASRQAISGIERRGLRLVEVEVLLGQQTKREKCISHWSLMAANDISACSLFLFCAALSNPAILPSSNNPSPAFQNNVPFHLENKGRICGRVTTAIIFPFNISISLHMIITSNKQTQAREKGNMFSDTIYFHSHCPQQKVGAQCYNKSCCIALQYTNSQLYIRYCRPVEGQSTGSTYRDLHFMPPTFPSFVSSCLSYQML